MSRDLIVYRSTDAAVLDAYHAAIKARQEWSEAVNGYALAVEPQGKRQAVTTQGGMSERFCGVEWLGRDDAIPEGWRLHRVRDGIDHLRPHKSTKAGKAIAAEMAEVGEYAPDVRKAVPGMPDWAGLFARPGYEIRDGALYALWSTEVNADVDESLWEHVPLSRYYAMVEREAS